MSRGEQKFLLSTIKFTNSRKTKTGVCRTGIVMPATLGPLGTYILNFIKVHDITMLTFKNRVGIQAELFTNILSDNGILSDKNHDSILSYVRGRLGVKFDKVMWANAVAGVYHIDGTPLMKVMHEVMLNTCMNHHDVAVQLKLTDTYLTRILHGAALLKSDISLNLITFGQRYIHCDELRERFTDTVSAVCQLPDDSVMAGRIEGLTGLQKRSVLSLITKLEAINRA